jgi:hypothetical protein
MGARAIWEREPPGDALRRSEARLSNAEEQLGARHTEVEFYLADFNSTAASTLTATIPADFFVKDESGKLQTIETKFRSTSLPESIIGFSDSIIVWRALTRGNQAELPALCKDRIGVFNSTLADGDFSRGVVPVGEFVAGT